MFGAKLNSPGRHTSWFREKCLPKEFHLAFADFLHFYKKHTGIAWDDRFDGLPQDPNLFKYDPPKLGRPVGLLPPEKKAPSWDDEDEPMSHSGDSGAGLVYDTDSDVEDVFDSEHSPKPLPVGRRSMPTETLTSSDTGPS